MATDRQYRWRFAVAGPIGLALVACGVILRFLAERILPPPWLVPWVYWLYWPPLAFAIIGAGALLVVVGIVWLQYQKAVPRAARIGVAAAAIVLAGLLFLPVMNYLLVRGMGEPKLYLAMGADPNHQGPDGSTFLSLAASRGDTATCKLLLDRGADVNRGNPLAAAAYHGHGATVKLLLDAGAKVNSDNGSALLGAAIQGYPEVVGLLLDSGAEIDIKDERGYSPLYWAVDRAAIGSYDPKADHYGVTVRLIDHGADAKQLGPHGETLLINAGRGYKIPADLVRLLIREGVDVNAKSPRGETVLMEVVCYGHRVDIAEILIQAGADPNMPAIAPEGILTPLQKAILQNDAKMVTLLKSYGARE